MFTPSADLIHLISKIGGSNWMARRILVLVHGSRRASIIFDTTESYYELLSKVQRELGLHDVNANNVHLTIGSDPVFRLPPSARLADYLRDSSLGPINVRVLTTINVRFNEYTAPVSLSIRERFREIIQPIKVLFRLPRTARPNMQLFFEGNELDLDSNIADFLLKSSSDAVIDANTFVNSIYVRYSGGVITVIGDQIETYCDLQQELSRHSREFYLSPRLYHFEINGEKVNMLSKIPDLRVNGAQGSSADSPIDFKAFNFLYIRNEQRIGKLPIFDFEFRTGLELLVRQEFEIGKLTPICLKLRGRNINVENVVPLLSFDGDGSTPDKAIELCVLESLTTVYDGVEASVPLANIRNFVELKYAVARAANVPSCSPAVLHLYPASPEDGTGEIVDYPGFYSLQSWSTFPPKLKVEIVPIKIQVAYVKSNEELWKYDESFFMFRERTLTRSSDIPDEGLFELNFPIAEGHEPSIIYEMTYMSSGGQYGCISG